MPNTRFDNSSKPHRYPLIDYLRGLAVVWMIVYHVFFNLSYFRLIEHIRFAYEPLWVFQRSVIVGLFVVCAGVAHSLAYLEKKGFDSFWRQWRWMLFFALCISFVSVFVEPERYITFGVLHGFALMLPLLKYGLHSKLPLLPLGLFFALLPVFFSHSFFDSRLTDWLGLSTEHHYKVLDALPVFPWFGVLLLAAWLAVVTLRKPNNRRFLLFCPKLLKQPLIYLGSHSLFIFIGHQLVLFPLVWVLSLMM